jgi:hypothetical protein
MAQVVSSRPLTAEARVRAQVKACGICGGQSGTGTGFSPSSSAFPCQYIILPSLSRLISSGECVIYQKKSSHPRLGLTHPTYREKVHHRNAVFRRESHCLLTSVYWYLKRVRRRLSDHRLKPTNRWLPSTDYQLTSPYVPMDCHRHSYNERAVILFHNNSDCCITDIYMRMQAV